MRHPHMHTCNDAMYYVPNKYINFFIMYIRTNQSIQKLVYSGSLI